MNEILTQDEFLIQESVKYINEEWERGLDSWFNIGEHVLDTYFNGNPEEVKNKSPNKEHSFRRLCEHPELKMSHISLWRCTQLSGMERLYGTVSAWKQLAKSVKRLLLPIPEDEVIETANEIVDMSYRDAEAWIKQKYPKPSNWLKVDDVWNFPSCEEGYGTPGYDGRIPAQIVKNVLYYWTEKWTIVADPMVGGGTKICIVKQHENWREV